MSNWTRNAWMITGDEKTLNKVKEAIQDPNTFNFEKLIPIPEGLDDNQQFLFACDSWGTKWFGSNLEILLNEPTKLAIKFDTPWTEPTGIISHLEEMGLHVYGANVCEVDDVLDIIHEDNYEAYKNFYKYFTVTTIDYFNTEFNTVFNDKHIYLKGQTPINLSEIELVYKDEEGEEYTQPLSDIEYTGPLIDPETGDDLELMYARLTY